MSLYGTPLYGTFVYGTSPIDDRIVIGLSATRAIEGPQIILRWTKPVDYTNVTKLRIVQKLGSFPEDENDGLNIFETSDSTVERFTDFPSLAPEFFYYKIFTEYSSAWYSGIGAEAYELAHDTKSEKKDKFFLELAEIHRTYDKARFGSGQRVLSPTMLDAYEKIMLSEDGLTDQGELQRFLKLFNIFFNEPLALTRAIATRDGLGVIHDATRTSPQFLSLISALYGWAYNWDLPVDAARAEVLGLPDLYKKKGRKDVTTSLIDNIFTGHTVTIVPMDEVIDMNGYPNGFLNTLDLQGEIDFLTENNIFYVIADLTDGSSIGFNKVAIVVIPNATKRIKGSQVRKVENIIDDFFNILDDIYFIMHETFNLNYPTDFTTAGAAFLTSYFPLPNPNLSQGFGRFALGSGLSVWDISGTPTPPVGATILVKELYREFPRNWVYLDGSDNPTLTPTKKVLIRCFIDLNTFTNLESREAGQFASDSTSAPDTGTLLWVKRFPLRFIDDRVRYIVDFKVTFP